MKQLLNQLNRYKNFLITLAVVGILGHAGYQLSRIITVEPDQDHLAAQKQQLEASPSRLNLNDLQALGNLINLPSSVNLDLGKSDPFNP